IPFYAFTGQLTHAQQKKLTQQKKNFKDLLKTADDLWIFIRQHGFGEYKFYKFKRESRDADHSNSPELHNRVKGFAGSAVPATEEEVKKLSTSKKIRRTGSWQRWGYTNRHAISKWQPILSAVTTAVISAAGGVVSHFLVPMGNLLHPMML